MFGVEWKRGEYATVNPAIAAEWLKHCDPDLQRPVNEAHATKLSMMMTSGDFLTGHIVFADMGGKRMLANGQHSLNAIAQSGKAQRCLVETYTVQNIEAYSRLFHAFDTEARQRTWLECARAYKMGSGQSVPEAATDKLLNMFRNGFEYFIGITGAEEQAETKFHRFEAVGRFRHEFEVFITLTKTAVDPKLIRRAPIIAAVIATVQVDRDTAGQFWNEVVTGFFTNQGNQDWPPYRLHQFLRGVVIFTGGGAGKRSLTRIGVRAGGGASTQFDVYCACIHAWNAYCEGRTLKVLKGSTSGKVPGVSAPHAEVFMA